MPEPEIGLVGAPQAARQRILLRGQLLVGERRVVVLCVPVHLALRERLCPVVIPARCVMTRCQELVRLPCHRCFCVPIHLLANCERLNRADIPARIPGFGTFRTVGCCVAQACSELALSSSDRSIFCQRMAASA